MNTIKLEEVRRDESLIKFVGGKAYNLGVMLNKGFRVPTGFVLPLDIYDYFLEYNHLKAVIRTAIGSVNESNLFAMSSKIKTGIMSAQIPEKIKKIIIENALEIRTPYLAIRSSAAAEDTLNTSFAGLHDSFVNKKTSVQEVLESIKKCYASTYNVRASLYRLKNGMQLTGAMGVIVQEMVPAEISGVVFTSFPSSDTITIEASFGLGNLVVSGEVDLDTYSVNKTNRKIIKKIGNKSCLTLLDDNGIKIVESGHKGDCLTEDRIQNITQIALELEKFFQVPQDIEWAVSGDLLYILQARSFKPLPSKCITADEIYSFTTTSVIEGRIAKAPLVNVPTQEYILLVDMPKPQYVPFLEKAKAVVCNVGGILNHFAIVCRELGIPYLVIRDADLKFKDGEYATINVKEDYSKPIKVETDAWVKIMSYIPEPPEEIIQRNHCLAAQNLPNILNKKYPLNAKIEKDGIYVENESLRKFMDDSKNAVNILYFNLQSNLMEENLDFPIAILASILIDPLFGELTKIVGTTNTALMLIRGIDDPLYFSLKGDELYLKHFGLYGKKIQVPEALKSQKASATEKYNPLAYDVLAPLAEKKEKAEILIKVIKLLLVSYENKDKMTLQEAIRKQATPAH